MRELALDHLFTNLLLKGKTCDHTSSPQAGNQQILLRKGTNKRRKELTNETSFQ